MRWTLHGQMKKWVVENIVTQSLQQTKTILPNIWILRKVFPNNITLLGLETDAGGQL